MLSTQSHKKIFCSLDRQFARCDGNTASNVGSVVILLKQITAELMKKALQKVKEENQVRGMLENGVSLAQAFEENGIL